MIPVPMWETLIAILQAAVLNWFCVELLLFYQQSVLVKLARDLTRPISPFQVAFWKGNGTPYFSEIWVGELSRRWFHCFFIFTPT